MADREIRLAPPQDVFDARDIPAVDDDRLPSSLIHRLSKVEHANQFFPSPGSRLTPVSMAFPCCYLAASQVTAVAEVWGDRIDSVRRAGKDRYSITAADADKWGFVEVTRPFPGLRLCDLTDATTRTRVGLDSGTIFATNIKIMQGWAEVIARHPRSFDGIIYRSRLTDEECLVLWGRVGEAGPLHEILKFRPAGAFRDSSAVFDFARHMEMRVSFPAPV